jgi:hypothetical protein
MRYFSGSLVALFLMGLCSCVGNKASTLSAADAAKLRGKRVQVTHGETPPFAIMTPAKALATAAVGMAGSLASGNSSLGTQMAIQETDRMGRQNDAALIDPAPFVALKLGKDLAQAKGCSASATSTLVKIDRVKSLTQAAAGADYVLDVRTLGWTGVYFPFKWLSYRVVYGSQVQLIETQTGRVLCQGNYQDMGCKPQNAPSYDELTANNNAKIKQEMLRNEQASREYFRRKVFGL